ncbi:MAG: hypothetical protein DMF98_08400 [Acidobacteria bacterium]|nr:MAG: hypothetical protein DMF98_08400 [Acidobacteriota bacterium]
MRLIRRKRFRVVLLAGLVAAFVVPVGFALSLESTTGWRTTRPAAPATSASTAVASSIVVSRSTGAAPLWSLPVPDAAKLLIIGSVLIGLAAAVRKVG